MTASMSKSHRSSSPLRVEEEAQRVVKKQGIVTILGSDCERTKAASLRRTLSADMSSKKWLAQYGFPPMKKIVSPEELAIPAEDSSPFSFSSEGEEEDQLKSPGQTDVWRQMQSDKETKEVEKPGQFDIWSSILCQKAKDLTEQLPPPYVHPLVKRSSSSLSEKSLEICTESLGSETGSESFSSYPSSGTSDMEDENSKDQEVEQKTQEKGWQCFDNWDYFGAVKYSRKKTAPRPFPPPLASLSHGDGPSLRMHPHRENGRLVLEAVSVPSKNYFRAQREDGRLVLTIVNIPRPQVEPKEDAAQEFAKVFDNFEEEEKDNEIEDNEGGKNNDMEEEVEEEDERDEVGLVEKIGKENRVKEIRFVMEQEPKLAGGVVKVHRSALMMKKLMGLDNRNTTWPHKFNKSVNLVAVDVEEEVETTPFPGPRVARLIPSPPASAAAAVSASSFNSYEYFWRTKSTVTICPISQQCQPLKNNQNKAIISNSTPKVYQRQELLVLKGNKADYLFPLLRGCKEPRRSLLFGEPYCIATS